MASGWHGWAGGRCSSRVGCFEFLATFHSLLVARDLVERRTSCQLQVVALALGILQRLVEVGDVQVSFDLLLLDHHQCLGGRLDHLWTFRFTVEELAQVSDCEFHAVEIVIGAAKAGDDAHR